MNINNQNNFSKLINLSLLTTFYNQLKNEFVIYSEYENFYNNANSSIQQNKKDINSLNTNLSNNYYTKTEIDEDFDSLNQGIMTNYYSKSDIDGKIQVINSTIDSINQNINNNYYNKQYIDNNFLSLTGGTISGNLTINGSIIGNLTGTSSNSLESNHSLVSDKVKNKLIFTGYENKEYDGSSEVTINIPNYNTLQYPLIITFNSGESENVNKFTFNGSENKIINITPNSIGAASSSDLSNYLSINGGILNGNLTAPTFIGNLNGIADIANKLQNKLIFNGYSNYSYDGTSEVTVTIPSLLSQLQNDSNFATIDYVNDKISTVYKFKGSVENYSNLPTSDNQIGDVWDIINADPDNNIKAGDNVVWTGTQWDNLGGIVDLSNYYTKNEINNTIDSINQSISNINNNISNNYYNKTDIDNKLNNYLSLSGGIVDGTITANEFIGSLNGNASTSSVASKVTNKLIFTGAVTATYDGSNEVTVNIPSGVQGNYLPTSGGTMTGNINSQSIIPTSNSLYDIGSSSFKYNTIFANTFNGNATTSSTANKVANKLTFTGASTGTYDGSSPVTINIPTFQQTNGILTVQLNSGNTEGSNKFTFNGSQNKLINITPSSINAVGEEELNNYLPLTGGEINGDLYVNGSINATEFVGDLNGNADSSTRVSNYLTFTGYQSVSYDGSNEVSVSIPDKISQLTNDSDFATTKYVDDKEFVGLNKDSIIRYPKDLPIPEGYELVEEQFSALTDANNELILQAPLTAPPNSVINSDFLSWQRGTVFNYQTSSISANTYMPDCWYIADGSKNFILSQVPKGAHVEVYGEQSYFQITQLIGGYSAGDVVTMVVGIANHGNQFSMQQRIGNSGSNNKSITIAPGNNVFTLTYTLQLSDFDSNSNFAIQPFFGYCGIDYANCTINYIRLYPGSIAYNGYREDYATALMRCLPYVNLITYELTNYAATNSFAIRQSINIPNMIAKPTVTVISEGTQTNIDNIVETFPYTNYSCLSVSINSTNAGQVRVYGRTILLSCEGK